MGAGGSGDGKNPTFLLLHIIGLKRPGMQRNLFWGIDIICPTYGDSFSVKPSLIILSSPSTLFLLRLIQRLEGRRAERGPGHRPGDQGGVQCHQAGGSLVQTDQVLGPARSREIRVSPLSGTNLSTLEITVKLIETLLSARIILITLISSSSPPRFMNANRRPVSGCLSDRLHWLLCEIVRL